jgi:hypothetical protein
VIQSIDFILQSRLSPSNVLLDDDMVAHVSDFRLAKLLYINSTSVLHSSTNIVGPRGSVGYIAPSDHIFFLPLLHLLNIYSFEKKNASFLFPSCYQTNSV